MLLRNIIKNPTKCNTDLAAVLIKSGVAISVAKLSRDGYLKWCDELESQIKTAFGGKNEK